MISLVRDVIYVVTHVCDGNFVHAVTTWPFDADRQETVSFRAHLQAHEAKLANAN